MDCRSGCAACCIAPSISSAIPGMPGGKPAGVPCVQLTADLRCAIFGHPDRPKVCASLRPTPEMCGATREEALTTLSRWSTPPPPRHPERSEGSPVTRMVIAPIAPRAS